MKVGTNFVEMNYFNADQPFLNAFKMGAWGGTTNLSNRFGSEGMILDSNGYPTSFTGTGPAAGQTFTEIDNGILIDLGLHDQFGAQSAPYYPSGTWVLLYDRGGGTETFAYGGDATYVSGSAGRILLNVATATSGGIRIQINNLGSPTINNIRLVSAPDATAGIGGSTTPGVNGTGTNEALLNAGNIFTPTFLSRVSPFQIFRFMKWYDTVNNTEVNWSDRPTLSSCFWTPVPFEVQIALCNAINADGWFNMPINATNSYFTSCATLVHSTLNSNLKAQIEFGNEIWNEYAFHRPSPLLDFIDSGYAKYPAYKSDFASFTGSVLGTTLTASAVTGSINTFGITGKNTLFGAGITSTGANRVFVTAQLTGSAGGAGTYTLSSSPGTIGSEAMTQGNDFGAMFDYAILRAVNMNDLWVTAWGADASKLIRTLGGQNGFDTRNQYIVNFTSGGDFSGAASTHADVLATAPYWPNYDMSSITTLNNFFTEVNSGGIVPGGYPGGALKQTYDYTVDSVSSPIADIKVAQAAGLGLSLYEGGEQIVTSSTTYAALVISANRDPRMGTTITDSLNKFDSAGVLSFVNFTFAYRNQNSSGFYGSLENLLQTPGSPSTDGVPRYDALVDFIGSSFTLDLAPDTYLLTGANATIFDSAADITFDIEPGSYSIAGVAISSPLALDPGSYVITGYDVSISVVSPTPRPTPPPWNAGLEWQSFDRFADRTRVSY